MSLAFRVIAKAKVHRAVAGRSIADAGSHVVVLSACGGHNLHHRSNPVTIALGALQRNIQPVACAFCSIRPNLRVFAERRDDHNPTRPSPSKSPNATPRCRAGGAASRPASAVRACHWPLAPRFAKYRVGLLDIHTGLRNGLHMPACDEQIFPTIVIKVIKAGAIARHGAAELPHPAGIGNLLESLAGLVPIDGKGLVIQGGESTMSG